MSTPHTPAPPLPPPCAPRQQCRDELLLKQATLAQVTYTTSKQDMAALLTLYQGEKHTAWMA